MALIPTERQTRTINKRPLAVLVGVVCVLLTLFINKLFSTTDNRNSDCMEQVEYLRARIDKLEAQLDDYRKTSTYTDNMRLVDASTIAKLKKENDSLKTRIR